MENHITGSETGCGTGAGASFVTSANLDAVSELLARTSRVRNLDLKVEVPCPMKQRFLTEYTAFEKRYAEKVGRRPYAFVPTICPAHVEIDNTLRDFAAMTSPDQVPDLIVGQVFGDMLFTGFFDRFVKTGTFKQVIDPAPLAPMRLDQFADRYETFNPLALFPEVLLVDRKVLGDKPVPRRMEDLLDPCYEGLLGLPDEHEYIGVRFLMHILQNYGEDGLAAIERNAVTGFAGPAGARTAGTNAEPRAAIYLTPWIFAAGAHAPGRVDIVWPEDGLFVQPIALLVKKHLRPENEPILEWLLSEEVGRVFADNHFISTNPAVDNRLPEDLSSFAWLGWDWIYDNDVAALRETLRERFGRFHRPSMC